MNTIPGSGDSSIHIVCDIEGNINLRPHAQRIGRLMIPRSKNTILCRFSDFSHFGDKYAGRELRLHSDFAYFRWVSRQEAARQ